VKDGWNEGGFSMIELLFVMIIIGILCAIAIPMYLSQRDKAKDVAVREGGRTIAIAVQTYVIADKQDGLPPDATHDTLVNAGAIDVGDWPHDGYQGGPMTVGTDPGQYTYEALTGSDFEVTVYLAHGAPFIVP